MKTFTHAAASVHYLVHVENMIDMAADLGVSAHDLESVLGKYDAANEYADDTPRPCINVEAQHQLRLNAPNGRGHMRGHPDGCTCAGCERGTKCPH